MCNLHGQSCECGSMVSKGALSQYYIVNSSFKCDYIITIAKL